MANQQGNFGFRPVLMLGSAYQGQGQQQMTIASNETNSIFMGDPVVLNANGSISRGSSAGAELVGVFNGCMYTDPTSGEQVFSNYYPASTNAADIIAFVIDDPMVVFEIQAAIAFPIADLFGNFDIVYTTAGSTKTGISGAELQVTDGGTGTTLSVKAIDISEDPANSDVGAAHTNVLVTIQNHLYGIKGAGLA